MSKKPGVMIYFDMLHLFRLLSYEECGQLILAILEYAECGQMPELPDKLALAWSLIRPRLDNDDDRYYEKTNQAKYAAYVRWTKRAGEEPLTYEEWVINPRLTSKVDTGLIC